MVTVEEIADPLPSQERLWDAEEIEQVAASMKRPTARMHLESLAKKLRKESDALKRVERSKEQKGSEEKKEEESAATAATAAIPPAASAASTTTKQDAPSNSIRSTCRSGSGGIIFAFWLVLKFLISCGVNVFMRIAK